MALARYGGRVPWPDEFSPFGVLHVLVFLVSALGWWGLVRWAAAVAGTGRERTWRRAFALFVWVVNAAWIARQNLPEHFAWGHSLPLHLCDLAWLAAGWSLWSGGDPRRLRHQVTVLWGLALSALGYLTPAVTSGPAGIHFWTFWVTHWQILGVALVNVLVFRVRPDARGLWGTLLITASWLVVATAVNLWLDTSYCFTGKAVPSNPTPLDLLGPWPLRILWIALLGALALALVAWPFVRAGRRATPPP
jgi:hypothetical integral membrane protein (TIGR02206 family)